MKIWIDDILSYASSTILNDLILNPKAAEVLNKKGNSSYLSRPTLKQRRELLNRK